ncbi:DUF6053 domain-containing protein [Lysobacter enzymogenes]
MGGTSGPMLLFQMAAI